MAKRRRKNNVVSVPASEPPIRPGIIGLSRSVPASIVKPPYADTGEPGPSISELVRTPAELDAMRTAGSIAAEVLIHAGQFVEPGITTDKIDEIVHNETIRRGAYPSPLNYRGFRKSVCTSVNEVICHGIPDNRQLLDGDIINIDVTVYIDGVHGDNSCTFLVGDVDEHSQRLVAETYVSMMEGIKTVRNGSKVHDIGRAIERHARAHNLGVVREFIGHGVGTEFHSDLQIPHYYDPRAKTQIATGMTFTVEPMLTLGDPSLYLWEDEWTALTMDGRRSAQFEHTLVATDSGHELLTVASNGDTAAELYAPKPAQAIS
ncbi:MAG: methionyl aminopeptidase [Verrucomicrobiales bacterium]|jgi:methionyl aminopeptidase